MPAPEEETKNSTSIVRDEIVETAINFLKNPKVASTPLASKQNFLKRKGLTDQEIQIACEKSGAYELHESQITESPRVPSRSLISRSYDQVQYKSFFERLKEVVQNAALLSAVIYAIYMFYKKFISPFLFGKKKNVEERIDELNKTVINSVGEVKSDLTTVKIEIERLNQNTESGLQRELVDLKSEIATVKGLLLSRKQFPPVSHSPVVPPSIPAWQMSSVQGDPNDVNDNKSEDLMEMGSGSGSEPEHDTKKSDSSLEIM
ncbi:peroxisomal membrane protein PEX14 isoform X2 [Agrilus planipennis]|uniref:Peroxisomal membrane protein PEX14 n=1 Tax=Agrilus planipennis TaxID=224129 RepID=A0A1W4WAV1_AGRPL|nr:peroxisomal membrane protein PEX14 isoform X2 [Agrilus planipennis]